MTKPWQLISLVLIALSLILAIVDRAILQPMYLLVLALVVMYGTNTKFPWGCWSVEFFSPILLFGRGSFFRPGRARMRSRRAGAVMDGAKRRRRLP